MKSKLFLGLFAATGLLLGTSCVKEDFAPEPSENEAQVSFSLGLEGNISTRTISDGTGADKLIYAVFDNEGKRISSIAAVTKENVTFPTTENLTLAKGQTYKVAFWAQDSDCSAYTVNTDNMNVVIDYTSALNNDETRDAFFKTVEFTVTGSSSIDVVMKRPFAQVNVGVTQEDWNAAIASNVEIEQSSVVIKNAANSLNVITGEVTGSVEVNYNLAAIPAENIMVDTDANDVPETYKWLSMSYILPADETTGYDKTTLDGASFEFKAKNGTTIGLSQGLTNIPVQRNWRTNILGKILTGDVTFNITTDPIFENDNNVKLPLASINGVIYQSFDEAMKAVKTGETIKLIGETSLKAEANNMLYIITDKAITIDLNGYDLVASIPDVTKNTAIFQVKKGAGLTIEGKGNIKLLTAKCPNNLAALVSNEGGEVNLKGGNWTISALEYPEALIPTFVDNNSTIGASTLNIHDGTYTYHRNLFRNFSNHKSEAATINIYGGTFNGREGDTGAIWNQKPSANTPDDAGVINVLGGTFNNVVINDDFETTGYITAKTAEELAAAVNNATAETTVFLGDNIVGDVKLIQKEGINIVINGNGNTYNGKIFVDGGNRATGAETMLFTNIKFIAKAGQELNFIYNETNGNPYPHNITVENCHFESEAINEQVVGVKFTQAYHLKINKCTAKNIHSLAQFQSIDNDVTVNNVTVENCKNGISFGNTAEPKLSNSVISTREYGVRADGNASRGNLVITNTKVNAALPVIIRKMNTNYTVAFKENNKLTTNNQYHVIFTNGTDDLAALATPTGKYTLTGAENFNVYPREENTVLKADNDLQLANLINTGETKIELLPGNFIIPDVAKGKTLTFIGTGNPEETKIATQDDGSYEGCDYSLDGSTVTFENISINTNSNTYTGYARCAGTYKNCIINGTYTLYGNSTFENCTLNVNGDVYNIWTWGAPEATFKGCTFISDGKAMLLYGTENTKLTIDNCTFNDKGGLIAKKAAIEIGNDYDKSYQLFVNNTTVNGYEINDKGINTGTTLWANKNSMSKDKLNVVVDGVDVY